MSQRIELPACSMLASTPIYDGVTAEVEGAQEPVVVPGLMVDVVVADGSDEVYIVPQAGAARLDLIAHKFYGTPDLWWVLARVNNLSDPLVGFPSGAKIRVPTRQRLAAEGVLTT